MRNKFFLTICTGILLVFAAGCLKDDFIEIDGVCPVVISTYPTNGETNVPLDPIILVNFNEEMDPSTITEESLIIEGASPVAGTVSYSGTTAVFTPSGLLMENTTYTGKVRTTVKDKKGNALQTDYIWTFSTGETLSPLVISTDPADLEKNVTLNKIITATFNMPMDASTVTTSTFYISQNGSLIDGEVTFVGTTASFKPSLNLKSNTTYQGFISSNIKSTEGSSLVADYIWTFTTGSLMAPMVIATDPTNRAIDVELNKIISATFSEPMDIATITNTSFLIREGASIINGAISFAGTTVIFTPDTPLKIGTLYTGTITKAVTNLSGVSLTNDYVWTFTTSTEGLVPIIISTDPANNASQVLLNKTITATFNVAMDPSTFNESTFTLNNGTINIPGKVSYSGIMATFNPTDILMDGVTYTASITNSVRSIDGISMQESYSWTFSTGSAVAPTVISTDPTNNSSNVGLTKTLTATFSVPMDPTTINSSTFTLFRGGTQVSGVVTYSGTTASFNPLVDLVTGAVYTATITTDVKNIAGVSMINNYVWTFSTGAGVAPTVISTDPTNNSSNVGLTKTITATFSVPMDPTTINSSTFTLFRGGTQVSGVVTYSGSTASFNPLTSLLPNTSYTATITAEAKNSVGVPMSSDYSWVFTTSDMNGPPSVILNSVETYGIFAGVGISNNAGLSQIVNMDVGITPGVRSSVTGFPPATIINGAIYASDDVTPVGIAAVLNAAKQDLTDAYLFAEGASTPAPIIVSGDIGGTTLTPGIYKTNSTLLIQSGDLTLDAQGNANAVWIFQVASGLTTIGGAGGNVILSGGAKASNIFWQIGSSATVGDFTNFKGNILALTSITMNSGASSVGRMLCINGAVVMTNTNFIIKP